MRALLAAVLVAALAVPAAAVKLTVVHTNDIHGWIMKRPAAWFQENPSRLVGGAAALAAFYKSVEGPKLLLDGGDWFQGTPEGNGSLGMASVDVFNALPYDAVVVGNHDFDFSEKRLKELVAALKMPVLGANVYEKKTKKRTPYLKSWFVKDVGGVKVGVFGLITTNMRNLTFAENFEGLEFRDEVAEARDAVAALKKQGAAVIIMLDHVGFQQPDMKPFTSEQAVARAVPGIDLIVGGHSHTFLRQPVRDEKNGTLIVQAGSYLSSAGRVTLEIDARLGKVISSSGELVDLWIDKWGEDPGVAAVVEKHAAKAREIYDVVIATAAVSLMRDRNAESALGDWITDCEREWAGADVALQNGGGIRADLPAGPVTLRTIFNIMPFDNYVVKLDMDGALVRAMLDHGVDKSKGLSQISGATLTYDREAASGSRVTSVMVGGKPLDAAAAYKVATVDFLVQGGDGYSAFSKARKTENTKKLLRDVMAECARAQKKIDAPKNGRLTPVGGPR